MYKGARVRAQHIKLLSVILALHIGALVRGLAALFQSSSCSRTWESSRKLFQCMDRPLPPTWETRIEFQAPAFSCRPLGSELAIEARSLEFCASSWKNSIFCSELSVSVVPPKVLNPPKVSKS